MAWEADCSGTASSPNPSEETIRFLPSRSSYSHDSLRWCQGASICTGVLNPKSSVGRGNEENVPIFGAARGGEMAHSLSLRELWVFSNRGYYSSEGQHLHLPRALHLAGTFFDYRAFVCHIKSVCQAFYNGYLLFLTATSHPTSALPFKLQEAAAPSSQSQPFQGSSGSLWLGHGLILIKVQLQKLQWSESRTGHLAAVGAWRITMIADLGKKKIL